LTGDARFDADAHQFTLQNFPAGVSASVAPPGSYRMQPVQEKDRDTAAPEEFHYRPGHPLAECLIERAKARTLAPCELTLDYSRRAARVALVEQLQGKCGWLRAEQLTLTALETEDTILLAGITDDGIRLDRETCEKLLTIPAQQGESVEVADETRTSLETAIAAQQQRVIVDSQSRNETYFDAESDKLDQWAEDLKENLERELKNLEAEIRDAKKLTRLAVDLQGKIAAQKQVKDLEHKRNEKRRDLYAAQDEIERKKDSLIADVEARLQQSTTREELFTIRWRVV
jgi:adenine-specific DNA-methyltransferase